MNIYVGIFAGWKCCFLYFACLSGCTIKEKEFSSTLESRFVLLIANTKVWATQSVSTTLKLDSMQHQTTESIFSSTKEV